MMRDEYGSFKPHMPPTMGTSACPAGSVHSCWQALPSISCVDAAPAADKDAYFSAVHKESRLPKHAQDSYVCVTWHVRTVTCATMCVPAASGGSSGGRSGLAPLRIYRHGRPSETRGDHAREDS